MKKWSLKSIILGGGIALFIPLICYFILRSMGHTGHIVVPGNYGIDTIIEKTVDGKTELDTLYHTIQDSWFTTHLNKPVNLASDYPRKTLVVNFFTTGSNEESEKLTYHMAHIQRGFKLKKHDTSIQLLSITTNPDTDDIIALREYADKHSLDHDTWTFLRTEKDSLLSFAANELFAKVSKENGTIENSETIYLIDKYRNIRGYYNGLDSMEIKRCIDDIAYMMVEKNKIHEKKRR